MNEDRSLRRVKSYVLRQGRLTSGQANALRHFWQRYGIEHAQKVLDLNRVFGRTAPKVLDIGVGMGDTSIALARAQPENDFLAVEVHRPGVGSLIRQAQTSDLDNIRVICEDVIDVLSHQIASRTFDKVFIFFPDPWPKKRHHKRRLINQKFLMLLLTKLKTHGQIFIATDWSDLADHILEVCDNHPGLINLAGRGNTSPRPTWRPLTRFELRGGKLEHVVYDFVYCLSNDTGHGKN